MIHMHPPVCKYIRKQRRVFPKIVQRAEELAQIRISDRLQKKAAQLRHPNQVVLYGLQFSLRIGAPCIIWNIRNVVHMVHIPIKIHIFTISQLF